MQKKKLDEIFQDKLSDFKPTPSNEVWRKIDASLEKKKKKRVIPLWWQLGGIAAVLALGLLLFNPFLKNNLNDEIIVDTKKEIEKESDTLTQTQEKIVEEAIDSNNRHIVEKTDTEVSTQSLSSSTNQKNQDSSVKGKSADIYTNQSKRNSAVVNNQKQHANSSTILNSIIAKADSTQPLKNDATLTETFQDKDKSLALIPTLPNSLNNKETRNTIKASTEVAINKPTDALKTINDDNKKSIFEEIEEQEEVKQKVANNKWSAGPSIAPVYFNGHGKGSPVNSIFTPNSKSGNINFSYGLSVAYEVSKKITIRSGINKVDYSYDTEDVAFSSSINPISTYNQLATIDYAPTSETLTVSSKKVASENFSTANSALDVTAKSATRDGFMSQQFGYLELPIEVNYAVIDKKIGVHIIGGVSSLFLIDNSVSLTAGDLTTEIGEANNINDLNFSANMGLGLNYKFSSKVHFNLEPIFKYQLNTFSEIDGTFKPYSIGVYSGLSFKF
ncbi:porin family protein [Maribacter hydrothermalis]|uniref:Outer membrane protein beta-barrel domain-containing protein n=1 Tax=Maribacter hydrothermalis TaxID=1836467 RepID=A0A1B7ZEM6_9FLAO|nr:outer membrane beta-barrel protein [Maribacter hydrothermalis]APQ17414.1 hypothetical protein BTR34_08790 [Maribacter hydrothermalis]OBR41892.1 hypothetical protein A9200_00435 [Maribacter hydrothermalis]